MNDLISRQAVIDAFWSLDVELRPSAIDAILNRINGLPSERQEIIRCRDCKHYVIHTLFGHRQGWCERLCDEFDKSLARGTEEDDFCSRAEEKTDG